MTELESRFHWYENPNDDLIKISHQYCIKLMNLIRSKFPNFSRFCLENKINHKSIPRLKGGLTIRVKTFKKILDALNISYNQSEKYVIRIGAGNKLFQVKFPIELENIHTVTLVAAFLSDGCNDKQHPFYSNQGFLGEKIIQSALEICPNMPWKFYREKVRFHPMLGRILFKAGVPYGRKVIKNPSLPEFIFSNNNFMKTYLVQAFDDEGHAATNDGRKIVLGRSVAIQKINQKFTDSMILEEKIPFNKLPEDIKEIVRKQPPKLLKDEAFLLNKFGINCHLRCRGLTRYKNYVSADWIIEIFDKNNIRRFNEKVGFSEPNKIKRMEKYLVGG